MAALVAGVQYGLSSHSNFHENKSLIFVKLTDSAQRAIEDYLKNRNKINQSPTIQFLGNKGQLSFPSSQPSHGSTGFTFSLSSNHDIEGPQGAFECVQQTGPKSLESLGTLPCKMRIQANDDVYETTRHRMAVAEENSKNKCTRVIKANGPDIGRKVKVKATGRTIPLSTTTSSSSSNVRHRESMSIPTTINQSRLNYHTNSSTMSSSAITSSLLSSSLSNSSHKSMGTNNPPMRMQQDKKLPELMRRPLKERLIHVLALRPYKKPELYDRITREGIKERDRSTMTTILKQVAFMRDNTYHLHRHVWNDVQEDWPFYNEQDRAMLKRRKPQNLTPPGSSDGSSGSGQSPNSTHPGSPPAITAPPPSLLNSKRPGYYQGNDGLQTKRPRISHYRKPEPARTINSTNTNTTPTNNPTTTTINTSTNNSNTNSHGPNGTTTSTNNTINTNETNNWEHQQQNRQHQRDRIDYRVERIERTERTNSDVLRGSYTTIAKSCLTPTSDCDENIINNNTNNINNNNNNINNNNNNNNGNRYGNNTLSATLTTTATTTTVSSHNSTSINMHNSVPSTGATTTTTTTRHSNINGNDKITSNVNSGNCVGAGVFDHMRSGGNKNSVSVGGGGSSSNNNSSNNSNNNNSTDGGKNRGYGASPCNVGDVRRNVGDFRDGRNDRERGGDREQRELLNKNIGSATGGINSYCNDSSNTNFSASNNFGNNGNTSSSTSSSIAGTVSTTSGSSITPASPSVTSDAKTSEYPDYLTQYTAINDTEQRRRYKAEFNLDYEEYRRLHTQVAKVSKRFAQLEERRQRELELGNYAKCEELADQIVSEYISTKNDPARIETKKRFNYLHEKLSHIKRLVLEYDTQYFGVTTSGNMSNNCDDILSGSGDLRY